MSKKDPQTLPVATTLTLISTRRLLLADLSTPIEINLWEDDETGRVSATASHAIRTPSWEDVYVPHPLDRPMDGDYDADEALGTVVSLYKVAYAVAIQKGLAKDLLVAL
jgi:hypothetical protein